MDAAEARTAGPEIKTSTSGERKRRLTLKCLICLTTYFSALSISPIRACGEAQLNPTPSDNRCDGQLENTTMKPGGLICSSASHPESLDNQIWRVHLVPNHGSAAKADHQP